MNKLTLSIVILIKKKNPQGKWIKKNIYVYLLYKFVNFLEVNITVSRVS